MPEDMDPTQSTSTTHASAKDPEKALNTAMSKLDQLEATLAQLQAERRTLLLALKDEFSFQGPSTSSSDRTSAQSTTSPESVSDPSTQSSSYQPSTHAHTQPNPPLTPAGEAQLLVGAQGVIKDHIKLLGQYNEIRDAGQQLIGLVADRRELRVRDVQGDFGVGDGD
jgi:hypothetical protein